MTETKADTPSSTAGPKARAGLSARLLIMTIIFVMLAEILIYVPSVSRYRKNYLKEQIMRAHIAVLALADMPDGMVNRKLEEQLLFHANAHGIVLRLPGRHVMAMRGGMPPKVDRVLDLREDTFVLWVADAFETLRQKKNRVLRVIGDSPKVPGVVVEVVMDERPMRREMYAFSRRILQLSILISLMTAFLVYLTLQWLMVRPMRRITTSMMAFRDDPEDESRTISSSNRSDEIGIAQRELNVMQQEVRSALRQKTRLATLGAAVAKINHDLRNTLATAVLVSDRLANIDDPEVKKVTPRLYNAIDRAVHLCSDTLNYVADGVPKLERTRFPLSRLVEEAGLLMTNPGSGEGKDENPAAFLWQNDVPAHIDIDADYQQLFRALFNLGQNAQQAGATRFAVAATAAPDRIEITATDDGPGLTARAKEQLFQPFAGSTRRGGIGLGLVIVRDILRAHGGDIELVRSGDNGTAFRLTVPLPKDA
ncbi:MAG: HAMP domain-containing sensor histidine kinase [Rhodospirillales bacterium]